MASRLLHGWPRLGPSIRSRNGWGRLTSRWCRALGRRGDRNQTSCTVLCVIWHRGCFSFPRLLTHVPALFYIVRPVAAFPPEGFATSSKLAFTMALRNSARQMTARVRRSLGSRRGERASRSLPTLAVFAKPAAVRRITRLHERLDQGIVATA